MSYQKIKILAVAAILISHFLIHDNTFAGENVLKIGSVEETCNLYVDDPSTAFKLWANKIVEFSVTLAEKTKDFSRCMNDEEKFTVNIFVKPDNSVGCICSSNEYRNSVDQSTGGESLKIQGKYEEISKEYFKDKGLFCHITLSDCRFKLEPKK